MQKISTSTTNCEPQHSLEMSVGCPDAEGSPSTHCCRTTFQGAGQLHPIIKGIYGKGKETSGPPAIGGEQEKEVPLELPNCLKLVHLLNDRTWFPKCNISQVILSFCQFRVFSTALQRKK